MLPPAYGLANVKNETYTAEGPISYWNAYVAVTQMGGQGNFSDARLKIDVKHSPDMVTSEATGAARLPTQPHGAKGSGPRHLQCDDAPRGKAVFDRACASCHVGGNGTDNDSGKVHRARETGMDGAYAMRTKNKASTAPRRCAACGSTRRISMTAAPRRSMTWWITTTRSARSS